MIVEWYPCKKCGEYGVGRCWKCGHVGRDLSKKPLKVKVSRSPNGFVFGRGSIRR